MINENIYNQRIETNLKKIHNIVNDSSIPQQAVQSYKIMKLLRNECLFVSKEYLAAKNHEYYATLDPYDEGVKNVLSENNLPTEWYPIFANSFGPFNPKAYFESPIKILWVLKEPFISKESWVKGDRGGHDQAKENRHWSNIVDEENPTLKNLIGITRTLINEIIVDKKNKRYTEEEAMFHISILELNPFPGLNFKKADSYNNKVCKWGILNIDLIRCLIDFYSPNIVIGCRNVLFPIVNSTSKANPKNFSDKIDLFNWLGGRKSIQDADFTRGYQCTILNRECSPVDHYREKLFSIAKKEEWKNYASAVVDNRKCLWVNCNHHPSSSSWNDTYMQSVFSNWVNSLYQKYCK